jgi:HSP20 family protein
MALIKWNQNPVDVLPGFSNLIDTFLGRNVSDILGEQRSTVPAVNILENKDNFMIDVAAPGMKKENFEIKLDNNTLTISAKKEEEQFEQDEMFRRREFSYSSFQRSFYLPEVIKEEKIEAHYKDGILEIVVPKKE